MALLSKVEFNIQLDPEATTEQHQLASDHSKRARSKLMEIAGAANQVVGVNLRYKFPKHGMHIVMRVNGGSPELNQRIQSELPQLLRTTTGEITVETI